MPLHSTTEKVKKWCFDISNIKIVVNKIEITYQNICCQGLSPNSLFTEGKQLSKTVKAKNAKIPEVLTP